MGRDQNRGVKVLERAFEISQTFVTERGAVVEQADAFGVDGEGAIEAGQGFAEAAGRRGCGGLERAIRWSFLARCWGP